MKKIAIIYTSPKPESLGNVVRYKNIQILQEDFELIIMTNQPEFIKTKISKCKIIKVNKLNMNYFISQMLFWLTCNIKLFFIEYDLLYLDDRNSPISILNFKSKTLCHIYQTPICFKDEIFSNVKMYKKVIKKIFQKLYLMGMSNVNFIIAVSTGLKAFLENNAISNQKISYAPHAVDIDFIRKSNTENVHNDYKLPNDKFILMYAGSINEDRGLEVMLKISVLLSKVMSNFLLVLVGATELEKKNILSMLHKMDICDSVRVIEKVDYSKMPYILSKANLFINIFTLENNWYNISPPQKIFEYFAAGKPILGNNIPMNTTYITDGYNGLIVNGFDAKDYVQKILRIVNDNKMYCRLCENSSQTAKLYDLNATKKNMIKLVNDMMGTQNEHS